MFGLAEDASEFVETKDKLEKYYTISCKQNGVDAVKYMEDMEAPAYTDPEKPTKPTDRVSYKKWDRKFNCYDRVV